MNEIQLSDSLPVIETEIRQFQNLAGESIFEIGRRLKHVKENDLAHGEFGKWLERMNMDWNTANRFMKVSQELPNSDTYHNLGSNALYLITTLPKEERTKEHVTSKGETKTPDEMTVKELRELKKQLKQRDELIASREQENEILLSKLEDAENKEPEVIERYSEPDDYQEVKEKLKQAMAEKEEYRQQLSDWHMSHREREEKSRKYDELNEAIKEMDSKLSDGQLRFKNRKFVNDLVTQSRILMKEVAPLTYSIESLHPDDLDKMKKSLNDLAGDLYKISKDIKEKIDEGIVVNE